VIFAVTALFGLQLVTSSLHAFSAPSSRVRVAEPAAVAKDVAIDSDEPREDLDSDIDLNGNAVDPAVAEYSFDALGGQYEVHSPQTELPRLGSSKT
jgi:hypothetical protein